MEFSKQLLFFRNGEKHKHLKQNWNDHFVYETKWLNKATRLRNRFELQKFCLNFRKFENSVFPLHEQIISCIVNFVFLHSKMVKKNVEIPRKTGFPTAVAIIIYRSGEIIRKWRKAESAFLHETISTDQLYNPTKYH